MNKPAGFNKFWILIFVSLIVLGGIGFALNMALDYMRPASDIESELKKAKAMLREGFDRNKTLAKENEELNKKMADTLLKTEDKEAEAESLRKQLQTQLEKIRTEGKDSEGDKGALRLFIQRSKQHQHLKSKSLGKINTLNQEIEELKRQVESGKKSTAELQDQLKRARLDLQGIQLKGSAVTARSGEASLSGDSGKKPAGAVKIPDEARGQSAEREADLREIDSLLAEIKSLKTKYASAPPAVVDQAKAVPQQSAVGPGEDTKKDRQIHRLTGELEKTKQQLNQDRSTFFYNLGVVYTQHGLYQDAAEMYRKALEINPDDASSHYNLAILYDEHLAQKDKAVRHYKSFIDLKPTSERRRDVEVWIRTAEMFLGNSRKDRADSARTSFENVFLTSAG